MEILAWFDRGGLIMYPILLCSIVAVYIVIERLMTLRTARPPSGAFQIKLRKVLGEKDVRLAQELCIQEKSPVGRIVGAGLEKVHHGPMRVRQAMEDQGKEEITQLDKHLSVLASIGGIAPMIGFLGTVTGLLIAFQAVAVTSGQPSPTDLADGIWEALVTTVFGLAVGIPAAAAYNYLVNQVLSISGMFERVARESLDAIEESAHIRGPKNGDAPRTDPAVPAGPGGESFPLRLRRGEAVK